MATRSNSLDVLEDEVRLVTVRTMLSLLNHSTSASHGNFPLRTNRLACSHPGTSRTPMQDMADMTSADGTDCGTRT